MAQLWVEDVGGAGQAELRVRDELGNVTTLSPHDSDGPAAIYTLKPGIENVVGYRNQFRGIITWINHETARVIRETFAKYNARRAGLSGHRDLVVEDWDANERLKVEHAESERSRWREQLAEYRLAIAKRSRLPWVLRGELPQPPGAEPPAYHVRPNPFVGV
jgi:hypothetical protein